jgi:hypothetical protein
VSEPSYKPGDVVNGHVLTVDRGWVPMPDDVTRLISEVRKPKKPFFARLWVWIAIAIVVGFVVGAIGAGRAPSGTAGTAADPSSVAAASDAQAPGAVAAPSEAAAPAESAAALGIGTSVRDGKFEFTLTTIEPPVGTIGADFAQQTAQGEYVILRVTVANIGDKPQTLFADAQAAYAGDTKYGTSSDALFTVEGASDAYLTKINPGNSLANVPLVFDVPAGTVLTKLELHDSLFSGGASIKLS